MKLRRKLTYSEAAALIEANLPLFKDLYLTRDMTARKVAENQNIEYDNNFQKALLRYVGSKGAGHGGKRPGSGNKKGVRLGPKKKA